MGDGWDEQRADWQRMQANARIVHDPLFRQAESRVHRHKQPPTVVAVVNPTAVDDWARRLFPHQRQLVDALSAGKKLTVPRDLGKTLPVVGHVSGGYPREDWPLVQGRLATVEEAADRGVRRRKVKAETTREPSPGDKLVVVRLPQEIFRAFYRACRSQGVRMTIGEDGLMAFDARFQVASPPAK